MNRFDHFFVDNQWVRATGSAEIDVVNPATERVVARLRGCSAADVHRAVSSAQAGLATWSRSTLAERKQALVKLRAALERRQDAFATALAEEMGAPLWISKLLHLPMPLNNLSAIAAGMDQIAWEETMGNALVVREPVGVVAGLTPWNAPIHQIVAKLGGTIAAGCSLVLKTSEITPSVGRLFFDAVAECGLPPGVVNMVWGDAPVGVALTAHPGVDMVSFTGSDAVGKQVMAGAAAQLKRLALELGGKSAALVLDDADLDTAIPAVVRQSMANSGQTCVCQSRLLVPRALLARAEQAAADFARQLRLGDPFDADTRLGPVATRSQLERIRGLIELTASEGGRLVAGDAQRPAGLLAGHYIEPTIISQVRADMRLAQQEVFGPVLAIMPYDDEAQGVQIANSTPYGLSGAVWSSDPQRAARVARQLRTGQVVLNGAAQNLAAPFGGFGYSGFGRENGRFSILGFLELKSIQGAACPAS
ncbi:MAG: aldehyde dehydrogenase family protein [Burkholderiaceae bacterium]